MIAYLICPLLVLASHSLPLPAALHQTQSYTFSHACSCLFCARHHVRHGGECSRGKGQTRNNELKSDRVSGHDKKWSRSLEFLALLRCGLQSTFLFSSLLRLLRTSQEFSEQGIRDGLLCHWTPSWVPSQQDRSKAKSGPPRWWLPSAVEA